MNVTMYIVYTMISKSKRSKASMILNQGFSMFLVFHCQVLECLGQSMEKAKETGDFGPKQSWTV